MGMGLQSHYTLRSSRSLLWFLSASCLLLLLVISYLPWALGWRIAGDFCVIAVCSFVGLRDARLSLAQSCVAFRLENENGITLIQRNGRHLTGTVSADGVVTPLLILMNIKKDGHGQQSIVLLPDSMNRDDFRRLRVALRWNRRP